MFNCCAGYRLGQGTKHKMGSGKQGRAPGQSFLTKMFKSSVYCRLAFVENRLTRKRPLVYFGFGEGMLSKKQ